MAASTVKNLTSTESFLDDFYYLPDPGLRAAVEVARDLQMPLLVTGEPGTGKTELARWIAKWIANDPKSEPLRFDTKTTSTAKDLFYRYDAIRHFAKREKDDLTPLDFITLVALGEAIADAETGAPRRVVLVDEIDKAPRDFPNDVLFQFEKYAFKIEEATKKDFEDYKGRTFERDENDNICCAKGAEPFLLLTSNSEKNLPDAFLRRCVFYHITFPEPSKDKNKTLETIVRHKARVSDSYRKHLEQHLGEILLHFEGIRNRGLHKKPATAELIRWIEALGREGREVFWDKIQWDKIEDPMRAKLLETMPVLLKTKEDLEIFNPNH